MPIIIIEKNMYNTFTSYKQRVYIAYNIQVYTYIYLKFPIALFST